jgi:two-component system, sensor histidine kinase and response regulator
MALRGRVRDGNRHLVDALHGQAAFQLPVPVRYELPTVLVSMVAAILASVVALFVVSRKTLTKTSTINGGVLMGCGIATMHYVGMNAMRVATMCIYSSKVVALSVLLGIVISFLAIKLTFVAREQTSTWSWRKTGSALLMGLAIPVVHYVGMDWSAVYPALSRGCRPNPRDQHLQS